MATIKRLYNSSQSNVDVQITLNGEERTIMCPFGRRKIIPRDATVSQEELDSHNGAITLEVTDTSEH